MKRLSRCITALAVSLLLLLPQWGAKGCGFYVWPGEYRFWLLQPDLTSQKELSPFYFAVSDLYPDTYMATETLHYQENVKDWLALTKHTVPAGDIDSLLYSTYPDVVLYNFDSLCQVNAFARYLRKPAQRDLYEYMRIAKKVEAVKAFTDPWQEDSYPLHILDSIVAEADALYNKSNNPNVRLRTAYQLMRLFRAGRDQRMLESTWKEKVAPVQTNSWVKGAALYELAANASSPEREYLFSRIFDEYTFKRSRCLLNFDRKNLEKALPYAANEHERTVLYAMQAFSTPGKILRNIRFIYQREPQYKDLEFLLLREINKTEDWLMTSRYTDFSPATYDAWGDDGITDNYKKDKAYAGELYAFVNEVIGDRKGKREILLQLYAAHLAFILNDHHRARQHLAQASKVEHVPANVRTQLLLNDLMLQMDTEQSFSASSENKLMHLLQLSSTKLGIHDPAIMKDQLILYAGQQLIKKGQRAKGLLLLGKTRRALGELSIDRYKSVYELMWEKANAADYDTMLSIIGRPAKTAFERFVTRGRLQSPWQYQEWSDDIVKEGWSRNKLLDLKAGWFIREDRLQEAAAVLQQLPASWWTKEPYPEYINSDPFFLNVYHAHSAQPFEKRYNKPQVVAAILQLKEKVRTDPAHAALYKYKLGNAYYNLSFYGKLWLISKPWRSDSEPSKYSRIADPASAFNHQYYGCTRAQRYYLEALQETKDKKLASLCIMVAGQCAQNNRMYLDWLKGKENTGKFVNPFVKHLQQKGMDSTYYQQIITECDTYVHYIQQLNKR